jgi:signal transduction histidine kinase
MGSIKLFAELIAFHLHAEQRLNAVEAELTGERAVSNLREQFIAVLGHDLRNPLASVRAGVDLIRRRPQRALELVDCIDQSLARMTGLIDNILDFARGRLGGGINLTMHHVEAVEPMLLQVIQELQVGHPEREVGVEFALHEPVICDHVRISQLLSNLLANALAHGASDQPIHVRATAANGFFELSVANAGRPIPPEALEPVSAILPGFSDTDQRRVGSRPLYCLGNRTRPRRHAHGQLHFV